MSEIRFGDRVRVFIPGHGSPGSETFVVGDMAYSTPNSRVVLTATEQWTGMPVNVAHCSVLSSGHDEICARLRDRYEKLYPGAIARLPKPKRLAKRTPPEREL